MQSCSFGLPWLLVFRFLHCELGEGSDGAGINPASSQEVPFRGESEEELSAGAARKTTVNLARLLSTFAVSVAWSCISEPCSSFAVSELCRATLLLFVLGGLAARVVANSSSSHTGRDASPLQGYPPAVCRRYPFIHLGGERQSCGAKYLV